MMEYIQQLIPLSAKEFFIMISVAVIFTILLGSFIRWIALEIDYYNFIKNNKGDRS